MGPESADVYRPSWRELRNLLANIGGRFLLCSRCAVVLKACSSWPPGLDTHSAEDASSGACRCTSREACLELSPSRCAQITKGVGHRELCAVVSPRLWPQTRSRCPARGVWVMSGVLWRRVSLEASLEFGHSRLGSGPERWAPAIPVPPFGPILSTRRTPLKCGSSPDMKAATFRATCRTASSGASHRNDNTKARAPLVWYLSHAPRCRRAWRVGAGAPPLLATKAVSSSWPWSAPALVRHCLGSRRGRQFRAVALDPRSRAS